MVWPIKNEQVKISGFSKFGLKVLTIPWFPCVSGLRKQLQLVLCVWLFQMASNGGRKLRQSSKSSEQAVGKPKRKRLFQMLEDLPMTEPETEVSTESVGKRTCKVLNKKECKRLNDYFNFVDYNALMGTVSSNLAKQDLSDSRMNSCFENFSIIITGLCNYSLSVGRG